MDMVVGKWNTRWELEKNTGFLMGGIDGSKREQMTWGMETRDNRP
jgi:hypothetical protein